MSYIDVPFPISISRDSVGGPRFETEIVTVASGREYRNQRWADPLYPFDLSILLLTPEKRELLVAHFLRMAGRAHSFPFRDPTDYRGTNQVLGTGDGARDQFALRKGYTAGDTTYWRFISRPRTGTVSISLDGVVQSSGWTVDTSTGIVTFTSAPGDGVVVTASYEFYIRVRYTTDQLNLKAIDHGGGKIYTQPEGLGVLEEREP